MWKKNNFYVILTVILLTSIYFSSEAKERVCVKGKDNSELSNEYQLYQLFQNQQCDNSVIPYGKKALIFALGKINTDLSKKYILEIINAYLKKGPVFKKNIWEDQDYMCVLGESLYVLRFWSAQKNQSDIEKLIGALTSENSVEVQKKHGWQLGWSTQEIAFQAKLVFMLEGKSEIEKIQYLVETITDTSAGKKEHWIYPGVKSIDAIKNGATASLLQEYGEKSKPYINQYLSNNPDMAKNKKDALLDVLNAIRAK